MLAEVTSNWIIGLSLAGGVVISGACFFVGQLSTRTTRLEKQVDNDIRHINIRIAKLEKHIETLEGLTHDILEQITGLRKDIADKG